MLVTPDVSNFSPRLGFAGLGAGLDFLVLRISLLSREGTKPPERRRRKDNKEIKV